MEPKCKLTPDQNRFSGSIENLSFNCPHNQSTYSLHGQGLNARPSTMSHDSNSKRFKKTLSDGSQRQSQLSDQNHQPWRSILSRFKPNKKDKINLKQTLVWQSTDTV
jgi:hypothetical protein